MSEKKSKMKRKEINLPIYNSESQMQYIIDFCKPFEFNPQQMLSYIIADWILLVQNGLVKGMDESNIFITYLEHVSKSRKSFDKIKQFMEKKNEQ